MAVPPDIEARRPVVAVARLLPTLAALALLALVVDLDDVAAHLGAVPPGALALAVALHAAIVAALAWRWAALVRGLGVAVGIRPALRLTFTATLLNMVLPTSVGGDVGRVWFGRRHGLDLAGGTVAGLADRLVGLAALALLVAACLPFGIGGPLSGLAALLAIAVVAAFGLALVRRPISGRLAALLGRPWPMAAALAVSLAAHVVAAVIAGLLARAMGFELSLGAAIVAFPAVMLAALLPVSVGGWGLRELAAIPMLGAAGLAPDAAAAVALAFGLTQVVAAGAGTAALALAAPR